MKQKSLLTEGLLNGTLGHLPKWTDHTLSIKGLFGILRKIPLNQNKGL